MLTFVKILPVTDRGSFRSRISVDDDVAMMCSVQQVGIINDISIVHGPVL